MISRADGARAAPGGSDKLVDDIEDAEALLDTFSYGTFTVSGSLLMAKHRADCIFFK